MDAISNEKNYIFIKDDFTEQFKVRNNIMPSFPNFNSRQKQKNTHQE
jgi:hypothetical protein